MSRKSKQITSILFVLIAGVILYVYIKEHSMTVVQDAAHEDTINTIVPISIEKQEIKEANFTGSKPVIKGSGALASAAREYVEQSVALFKQDADEQVPAMRLEFGADAPPSNYTIDIIANYTKGDTTESIILNQYIYTGGAHGISLYKVFTASRSTGKLLTLSDVIDPSKQAQFTSLMKKELLAWRPEDMTDTPVFKEDVNALTFASFTDWSFESDSLVIYFSQYTIGPGALGSTAFLLPMAKVKSFLVSSY